ncbi:unnamed protein product [Caenorhabditis bovis]|uniref:Uncharacterized protein n=1 Tax=Caenorhabditis bovis TaxID=2654633 RepID=A0A8S1EU78_9PELO|nr:unnamed protein product [Caenorhabditis bovis]
MGEIVDETIADIQLLSYYNLIGCAFFFLTAFIMIGLNGARIFIYKRPTLQYSKIKHFEYFVLDEKESSGKKKTKSSMGEAASQLNPIGESSMN